MMYERYAKQKEDHCVSRKDELRVARPHQIQGGYQSPLMYICRLHSVVFANKILHSLILRVRPWADT